MRENTFSAFDNVFHVKKNALPAKKAVQIFPFHEVAVLYRKISSYVHISYMKIA